jgi:hypothetical protein
MYGIGAKLTHALWCNLAEPKPGQDKTRLLVSYKIGETNRLSETLRQMTANTRMKVNCYKALCDTVPTSLVRSSMQLHNANINNVVMFFLINSHIRKPVGYLFLQDLFSRSHVHSSSFGIVLHGRFESLALALVLAYPPSRAQGYLEI